MPVASLLQIRSHIHPACRLPAHLPWRRRAVCPSAAPRASLPAPLQLLTFSHSLSRLRRPGHPFAHQTHFFETRRYTYDVQIRALQATDGAPLIVSVPLRVWAGDATAGAWHGSGACLAHVISTSPWPLARRGRCLISSLLVCRTQAWAIRSWTPLRVRWKRPWKSGEHGQRVGGHPPSPPAVAGPRNALRS